MSRPKRPTATPATSPSLPLIPLVAPVKDVRPGSLKIGEAARRLGISVHAIRLYENEGLLISLRSEKGTRWYTESDLKWISAFRELLGAGINFEGIRRLLAQVPCWSLRPCGPVERANCAMRLEPRMPCWIAPDKLCTEKLCECYHCGTYRRAGEFLNLKSSVDFTVKVKD